MYSSSSLPVKALEIKKRLLQGCHTLNQLKHVYAQLLRHGLDQSNYLLNMILRSCFESRNAAHACRVFERAPDPNIFLWNTMVRGLASSDRFLEVAEFYGRMRQASLSPNNFTFPFVLKACGRLLDLHLGMEIHTHVLKVGFEVDVFVMTSLVCLYAKCGRLGDAHQVFDEMPERNVVSWTAIICAYLEGGHFGETLDMFRRMLEMGLKPDSFTLVRVLSACCHLGDLKCGEWIHGYVEQNDMGSNVFVTTSLVDMYVKCGSMRKARKLFDTMPDRDIVTWSTMIAGYSSNGLPKEALELFYKMQAENLRPDCFTMVALLSACARLGALELGSWACGLIDKNEFLQNPVLGTALIDLYAKCGCTDQAWMTFQEMKERDVVVWNSIITALAMSGHVNAAFMLFAQMEKLGVRPDGSTFIGLLCGCTHSGLVDDGRRYFDSMKCTYSLAPKIEHYGCMVDLLGRAGLLCEAHQLIMDMPMAANEVVWGALLGGCRIHRNALMAEHALKKLIELEPQNAGNYVLLSNIYSLSGRWDDAESLRLVMNDKGIRKTPGCSWIEAYGKVHEFRVGDQRHPLFKEIHLKLRELAKQLKDMGYVPITGLVLFDVEEEEREHSIGHHSEKLAVAFGLISIEPTDPIRVVKNLRVCIDCHTALKLISKITSREIIVRDTNRFHSFKEGDCSCKDYW